MKVIKKSKENTKYQILISRLPYAKEWDVNAIKSEINKVDERSICCLSLPVHVESPGNGLRLITQLEASGLHLVALVSWHRDRHIVTTKSKRITNSWEPVAIFCKSKDWLIDRDGPARPRRGAAGREEQFDEDDFLTCIGDHWPVRCDRRDRRLLPAQIVLNFLQLGGITNGDTVFDPWGNPGIKEQCDLLDINYVDGGLTNQLRTDWKNKSRKKGDK